MTPDPLRDSGVTQHSRPHYPPLAANRSRRDTAQSAIRRRDQDPVNPRRSPGATPAGAPAHAILAGVRTSALPAPPDASDQPDTAPGLAARSRLRAMR